MKSKLSRVLLMACALTLGPSAAFAQAKAPDATKGDTDREQYIKALTALCPTCTKALQGVEADYKAKCGVEPTLEQNKQIVAGSVAYTMRLATLTLNNSDFSSWPPADQALYKGDIDTMACPAKK